MGRRPTYEECLAAAYEEYVRSWLDEHPLSEDEPEKVPRINPAD